jgi:hypothetical protein
VHDLFPDVTAVAILAVLAERFAVVGCQDDDRAVVQWRRGQAVEHTSNVEIGISDLAVVERAIVAAEIRKPLVLEVLLVGIKKMDP